MKPGARARRPVSGYIDYYLDCLREESLAADYAPAGAGVSWFAPPLARDWSLDPDKTLLLSRIEHAAFLEKLRNPNRVEIFFGYPVHLAVDRATGPRLTPVFLRSLALTRDGTGVALGLAPERDGLPEAPRVNAALLARLFRRPEEQRDFLDALGLLTPGDRRIEIADLLRRLVEWPGLEAREKLDPGAWTLAPALEEISEPGIHNRGIVGLNERAPYSLGLQNDLERLRDRDVGATALRFFFPDGEKEISGTPAESPASVVGEEDAIEIEELNAEQRAAVVAGMSAPLTVVTGPPGTGKSRVAAALLVNAIHRGERALLASKNHKALDVVESRVNSLADSPLILRLSAGDDRDLPAEISRFITRLLDLPAREQERRAAAEARARWSEALARRRAFRAKWDRREEADERVRCLDERRLAAEREWEAAAGISPWLARLWRRWTLGRERARLDAELDGAAERLAGGSSLAELADEFQATERDYTWRCRELIRAEARALAAGAAGEAAFRSLDDFRATLGNLANSRIGTERRRVLRGELKAVFPRVAEVIRGWCVSNLSVAGMLPLAPGLFDLVIIDEASQCDIASALPCLFRARRAVIIGDTHQIRHVAGLAAHRIELLEERHGIRSHDEQPWTYARNSLFDLALRAAAGRGRIVLREHFRSHEEIIGFSARVWYHGGLSVATDYRALGDPHERRGIEWTDVSGAVARPAEGGAVCRREAAAAAEIAVRFARSGRPGTLGVVTPFRAQANLLRRLIERRLPREIRASRALLVDTAHGFQGDERDLIIFSLCVGEGMPPGALRFLKATDNLFNVAVTRARALLHIVGDLGACRVCEVDHVRLLAERCAGHGAAVSSDGGIGPLERSLEDALRGLGLAPLAQYKVDQYRLDLAIMEEPDIRLAIEVDGEAYHLGLADLTRDRRLREQGWRVLRFPARRIRNELAACAREIAAAVAASRAGP